MLEILQLFACEHNRVGMTAVICTARYNIILLYNTILILVILYYYNIVFYVKESIILSVSFVSHSCNINNDSHYNCHLLQYLSTSGLSRSRKDQKHVSDDKTTVKQ